MQQEIEKLGRMMADSRRIVAFTGAGISTESGLPDFRSPGGVWSRYRPVTYPEFLSSPKARMQYWQRYLEFYPPFAGVKPNAGHLSLAELERIGRLMAVITQNVDRLHHTAGNSPDKVIELHGRIDRTICLTCNRSYETKLVVERVRLGEQVPVCDTCGGWLKPATISFGQNLSEENLERAIQFSASSDLFLAIGSSLTVQPAASLPGLALDHGGRLVVINATSTPYDRLAHLVLRGRAGQALTDAIRIVARSE